MSQNDINDINKALEQAFSASPDEELLNKLREQLNLLISSAEKQKKSNEASWKDFKKQQSERLKARGNELFSVNDAQADVLSDFFFSLAILFDPNNHVLFSNRSGLFTRTGKYEEAKEDAQRCISLAPDWPKGYSRLGAAYYGLQKYDDSYNQYKKALALDPNNAQTKTALAESFKKVEAEEANVRGEELMNKNKPSQAVESFTKSVENDPNNALYYCNRSKAYIANGQPHQALEDAEKTIALRPEWSKGYAARADAYFAKGEYNKSAIAYTQALQIEPSTKYQKAFDAAVQEDTKQRLYQQQQQQQQQQPQPESDQKQEQKQEPPKAKQEKGKKK
eukprot:TRINITY_DN2914_c0_g1_i1.p1 TRINITY_DN2914_c0_g1~~TRINITY_DN2914_c0_g1_i1.p1  ORF type:complete len:336 (+),score=86.13 TRINITY_DN2914_c0_g1_i1:72-1079(+)